jgi:hypothetical protein
VKRFFGDTNVVLGPQVDPAAVANLGTPKGEYADKANLPEYILRPCMVFGCPNMVQAHKNSAAISVRCQTHQRSHPKQH